jgi:hypothetical protein
MVHSKHTFAFIASSLAALALAACSATPPAFVPPSGSAATQIVVPQDPLTANFGPPQVFFFPVTASGQATPSNSILLPSPLSAEAVASDAAGNTYVATSADLRVYAAGASGSASPLRTIPANATTTYTGVAPVALEVDASGNLYVGQSGSIAVFGATANGSAAPSRVLSGSQTTLTKVSNLAIDGTGNIYALNETGAGTVSDTRDVAVFAPGASGNAAPSRTLNTGNVSGLAVDVSGNLYTTSVANPPNSLSIATIAIYGAGASGNATPAHTIAGSATGIDQYPGSIAVDGAGNIYVACDGNLNTALISATPTIFSFAAGKYGNIAPATSFTAPSWSGPEQITLH